MSASAHSISNTTIENGADKSVLGEDWTLLEYTMREASLHRCSDGIRMQGIPIWITVLAYDTDERETILLLANEGIINTGKRGSTLSVKQMSSYGADVDDWPAIFTRYGNKGRSSIITDWHEVNFKIHTGLHMVHMCKATEYELNAYHMVVPALDMLWNTKEQHDHYLSHDVTGAWDLEKCNKFADSTVMDILKFRL